MNEQGKDLWFLIFSISRFKILGPFRICKSVAAIFCSKLIFLDEISLFPYSRTELNGYLDFCTSLQVAGNNPFISSITYLGYSDFKLKELSFNSRN